MGFGGGEAVGSASGVGVGVGAGEGDGVASVKRTELTSAGVNTGVGEAEGEGVAPALQPPRSASDARPAASLAATVCQRIASRLRDACTPIIARRCRE